jgi:hypothetical protein
LAAIRWDHFYEAGTADVPYGGIGAANSPPVEAGGARWQFRAEALAVVRSDTLRHLGGPEAEHDKGVPIATVSLRLTYRYF